MSEFPDFDTAGFYSALDVARERRSLSWRQFAREAGVSPSTLTRVGQGRRPDADSLVRLCSFAGLDPLSFTTQPARTASTTNLPQIMALLRSDPGLDEDDADMLSSMVNAAYKRMKQHQ